MFVSAVSCGVLPLCAYLSCPSAFVLTCWFFKTLRECDILKIKPFGRKYRKYKCANASVCTPCLYALLTMFCAMAYGFLCCERPPFMLQKTANGMAGGGRTERDSRPDASWKAVFRCGMAAKRHSDGCFPLPGKHVYGSLFFYLVRFRCSFHGVKKQCAELSALDKWKCHQPRKVCQFCQSVSARGDILTFGTLFAITLADAPMSADEYIKVYNIKIIELWTSNH